MDVRVGLFFLFVFGFSWLNNVDARNLVNSNILAKQVINKWFKNDTEAFEGAKDEKFCTLCEQYASQAIDYLRDEKTQSEIIGTLHMACSHTHGFKQECTSLVDYYVPLFFLEIAEVEPEELCSKMNLCDIMPIASEDSCTICHEAVAEVLARLTDPDTQLEIIQILLKACEKTDQYAKKCKRLVFEYGPLIMVNAEKYLAKNDLCVAIHACPASTAGSEVALPSSTKTLLAES